MFLLLDLDTDALLFVVLFDFLIRRIFLDGFFVAVIVLVLAFVDTFLLAVLLFAFFLTALRFAFRLWACTTASLFSADSSVLMVWTSLLTKDSTFGLRDDSACALERSLSTRPGLF